MKARTRALIASLTLGLGAVSTSCAQSTGADAGAGDSPSDGGVDSGACPLPTFDAGLCRTNLDCPGEFYCDFTVTHCSVDGGTWIGSIVAGSCMAQCNPYGIPGIPCQSGEACGGTQAECVSPANSTSGNYLDFCTLTQPCDAGVCSFLPCTGSSSAVPCPFAGCSSVTVPHSCDSVCVCPGLTCSAAGVLTDAG